MMLSSTSYSNTANITANITAHNKSGYPADTVVKSKNLNRKFVDDLKKLRFHYR